MTASRSAAARCSTCTSRPTRPDPPARTPPRRDGIPEQHTKKATHHAQDHPRPRGIRRDRQPHRPRHVGAGSPGTIPVPANPLSAPVCNVLPVLPAALTGVNWSAVTDHRALNGKVGVTATAQPGYAFANGATTKAYAAQACLFGVPTVVNGAPVYGASRQRRLEGRLQGHPRVGRRVPDPRRHQQLWSDRPLPPRVHPERRVHPARHPAG